MISLHRILRTLLLLTCSAIAMPAIGQSYWRYPDLEEFNLIRLSTEQSLDMVQIEDGIQSSNIGAALPETQLAGQPENGETLESESSNDTQLEQPVIEEGVVETGATEPVISSSEDVPATEVEPLTETIAEIETEVEATTEPPTDPDLPAVETSDVKTAASAENMDEPESEADTIVEESSSEEISTTENISEAIDSDSTDPTVEIEATIMDWAAAWSAQSVTDYLNFYADNFSPAKPISLQQWREQRIVRISKPQFIELTLSKLQARLLDAKTAEVDFEQRYKSDTYSDKIIKRIGMIATNTGWKITREETVKAL